MARLLADGATLAWLLMAGFLVVGLFVYERTGARLGGVLVLPLLVLYALIDLSVVLVFTIGALASFLLGQFFYSHLLVYGRRLLYAFLLSGIAATLLAYSLVRPGSFGFVLALLPGLFSYNLHREGRYLEGMSTFVIWFGVLLVAATAGLWILLEPDTWARAAGPAVAAMTGLFGTSLQDALGVLVSPLAPAWDAAFAGGITLVAVASAAEGGAE